MRRERKCSAGSTSSTTGGGGEERCKGLLINRALDICGVESISIDLNLLTMEGNNCSHAWPKDPGLTTRWGPGNRRTAPASFGKIVPRGDCPRMCDVRGCTTTDQIIIERSRPSYGVVLIQTSICLCFRLVVRFLATTIYVLCC